MKNQIIQNVFKLMLGTSALLVSVAFFIRTISPVQASNSDNPITPEIGVAIPEWTIVGCGTGIYQRHNGVWEKVGP
jgi:hypothetical protein